MIHVYAFADGLRGLPEIRGLDGAPLETVSIDDVCTVFSRRMHAGSAEALRDEALEHGAVVDALLRTSEAVVPVRFGEPIADTEALRSSVHARAKSIRRSFDQVRGCVEIGLRVWGEQEKHAHHATGADYLRARAGQSRAVDELHGAIERRARDVRLDNRPHLGTELFAAAYLVPDARVAEVGALVDRFADDHPSLTAVCTGPWAPFSFGEAST